MQRRACRRARFPRFALVSAVVRQCVGWRRFASGPPRWRSSSASGRRQRPCAAQEARAGRAPHTVTVPRQPSRTPDRGHAIGAAVKASASCHAMDRLRARASRPVSTAEIAGALMEPVCPCRVGATMEQVCWRPRRPSFLLCRSPRAQGARQNRVRRPLSATRPPLASSPRSHRRFHPRPRTLFA